MDHVFPKGQTLAVSSSGSRRRFGLARLKHVVYNDGGSAICEEDYSHRTETQVFYVCRDFHKWGRRSYYLNNKLSINYDPNASFVDHLSLDTREYVRHIEIFWGTEPDRTFKAVAKFPKLHTLKIIVLLKEFPKHCNASNPDDFLRKHGGKAASTCHVPKVIVEFQTNAYGNRPLPDLGQLEEKIKKLIRSR